MCTTGMSAPVRCKYQEALSVVAVARSSQDTDSTVAMMLLQKAAGKVVMSQVTSFTSICSSELRSIQWDELVHICCSDAI